MTQSAVVVYGVIILASGFMAGAVAGEIRKYMQAALREAETQQQLQQVQHDLDIARSIQQSLLPRVRPRLAGFEIAGWNHSADATGGDYFDWKQLPDGRLVVTMADVTGHGIGPALLASICRAYSRASFKVEDSLPAILQHINESFEEDLTNGVLRPLWRSSARRELIRYRSFRQVTGPCLPTAHGRIGLRRSCRSRFHWDSCPISRLTSRN